MALRLQLQTVISCTLLLYLAYKIPCLLNFAAINPDAGTYLATARDIANGKQAYFEVPLAYTPLSIYFFSLIFLISPNPTYFQFLLLVFGFQIATSWLIYLTVRRLQLSRATALLFAIWSFVQTIAYEGAYIVLEPFVTFFITSSYFLLSKKNLSQTGLFATGALVSCAFLSKQYGALGFFPILILSGQFPAIGRLRAVSSFVGGFLIHLSLLCLALCGFNLQNLQNLVSQISGQNYLTSSAISQGTSLLEMSQLIAPITLASLGLFNRIRLPGSEDERLFAWNLILLTLFFFSPLLVRTYPHYFILTVPSIFMLAAFGAESLLQSQKSSTLFLCKSLIFVGVTFSALIAERTQLSPETRAPQILAAKNLSRQLPADSSVLGFLNPAFFFLTNLKPISFDTFGYGFIENLSNDQILMFLRQTQWVLIDPDDPWFYHQQIHRLGYSPDEFYSELKNLNFNRIDNGAHSIQIWKKDKMGRQSSSAD
jgi:4-amino-4-deoxy-L-arabinose transferase-like glycosyltransferase